MSSLMHVATAGVAAMVTVAAGVAAAHTHKGVELSQIEQHDKLGLQSNHAWQSLTLQIRQQFATH